MPGVQNIDADGDPEHDRPFDELRFLVRSPIDETHMLPEFIGVGDERADQAVRPGLLDQGGGRLLLRAEVLEY